MTEFTVMFHAPGSRFEVGTMLKWIADDENAPPYLWALPLDQAEELIQNLLNTIRLAQEAKRGR